MEIRPDSLFTASLAYEFGSLAKGLASPDYEFGRVNYATAVVTNFVLT